MTKNKLIPGVYVQEIDVSQHVNPIQVHVVDDEVVEWSILPKPYPAMKVRRLYKKLADDSLPIATLNTCVVVYDFDPPRDEVMVGYYTTGLSTTKYFVVPGWELVEFVVRHGFSTSAMANDPVPAEDP